MTHSGTAVHRTIFIVDVEGFGNPNRRHGDRDAVRDGMFWAVERALDEAGVARDAWERQDCGDGLFYLARPEVPKATFVESFPEKLVAALREHNRRVDVGGRIRLRMVLHAGEILYGVRGPTGDPIIHAFRLLDAQPLKEALAGSSGALAIMASSWFYDEVVRNSRTADPGSYRAVSVSVKETATTGWIRLPDEQPDPPHRAAAPRKSTRTLPRDTAAFTGRKEDLAKLLSAVTKAADSGQVVAIHAIDGMAGIGKTTFAVHAGHLLADRFPDAQLFVRLHAHTPGQRPVDPADALAALLTTLGVAARHIPADLDARAAMWRDRLAGKKVLLILDDAQGHQQVESLLPGSPGCLVIVTSRRRLAALDNATPLALDTLPPDEAAALFARLCARADIGAHTDTVAKLVRMCGYLPLGISLLAARLRHHPSWSVADLVDDLSTARDRLGRMRAEDVAVAAAFDLSYRDLPPDRQRVFEYFGLHPGTELDAHSVAALTDISVADARIHLDGLYNDHLLDEPAPDRYRMHDLVREYSRRLIERHSSTDRNQASQRLLDYYTNTASVADNFLAADITTDVPQDTEPRALTEQRSHLSTREQAWAWMYTESANLIACARHAAKHSYHEHVIRLAAVMARFLYTAGPWDQAIRLHQAAAAAAQHIGDQIRQADALNRVGNIQRRVGRYSAAIAAHNQALDIYRKLGRRRGQSAALNQLGAVLRLIDDSRGAAEADQDALAISRAVGDRRGEAFALNELGIVRLVDGAFVEAIEAHTQALDIYRELGDRHGEASALDELGVARRAIGDYAAAIDAHTQALNIYRDLGHTVHQAFALNSLGTVLRITGKFDQAIEAHREALSIARVLGDRLNEACGLNELGAAQRRTGNYADAAEAHAQALVIFRDLGHRLGEAETLNQTGSLLRATAEPHAAMDRHARALRIARDVHSPLEEARALEGIGRCEADLGDVDSARENLRDALDIYRRIGAVEAAAAAALVDELTQRRV